jgi:glycosyltransferase involved in cell wall biosynthesis
MAAGRPVIGSRVDGIPFYIEHGKTGLLFDSENIEQLAECLKKLCLEADYRHRMGREARLHSQSKFSERNYVEAFEAMLRAVLASESRRA